MPNIRYNLNGCIDIFEGKSINKREIALKIGAVVDKNQKTKIPELSNKY